MSCAETSKLPAMGGRDAGIKPVDRVDARQGRRGESVGDTDNGIDQARDGIFPQCPSQRLRGRISSV